MRRHVLHLLYREQICPQRGCFDANNDPADFGGVVFLHIIYNQKKLKKNRFIDFLVLNLYLTDSFSNKFANHFIKINLPIFAKSKSINLQKMPKNSENDFQIEKSKYTRKTLNIYYL